VRVGPEGPAPRLGRGIVLRSAEEIARLREAGRVVARVLEALRTACVPGVATRELDALAERLIREAGAEPAFKGYRGFPAAICVSVNEEVVHGIPGGRRLRAGDLVSCDVGASWQGYIGDGAWTFGVEPISEEAQRLLEVGERALWAGIAAARPGARVGDISHAVQTVVEAAGFSVVRDYCGHGVGTSMHEEPQVPNWGRPGTGPILRPGMVLAIEPMVNAGSFHVRLGGNGWTVSTRDGRPSVHFEHTVAIGDAGAEVLTAP
jgi:methionyl aminopeptidase